MATIHSQIAASHKAARVAHQEYRRTSVLLGATQSTEHILLGPIRPALREFLEQVLHHRRHDVARRNSINADFILTPFRGKIASELKNASLTGVVGGTNETLLDARIFMSAGRTKTEKKQQASSRPTGQNWTD
jgi:hypothetical protein